MRSISATRLWMGCAFAAAAVLAAAALAAAGTGEHGTTLALKATARLSFLLFWLAYAGGGLAVLFRPACFSLRRHARNFGLAFASAHLVHVALIGWLCSIGAAPATGVFVFFAPPLAVVYLLALFSLGRLQHLLGRIGWRVLRTLGMTYVAYVFATDFLRPVLHGDATYSLSYLPFAMLSVAGFVLHAVSLMPGTVNGAISDHSRSVKSLG